MTGVGGSLEAMPSSTPPATYDPTLTATLTTLMLVVSLGNDTARPCPPPDADLDAPPVQLDLGDSGDEVQDNINSSSNTALQNLVTLLRHQAPYAILVNKYVTPVCYVVGLVGNVVSALFWSSQRVRTCNTAALYLTALALADFGYLALHIFYELENPWLVPTLGVPGWCQLWNVLYMASSYLCVFLVCAFTVERFLSICHPFRSERFGRTRSPRIILLLVVLSLALGSPQAYFWTVQPGTGQCHVPEQLMSDKSLYAIWNWCTEMIVFGAFPIMVLALNVCVLRTIRKAGHLQLSATPISSLSSTSSTSSRKGKRRSAPSSLYCRLSPALNGAAEPRGGGGHGAMAAAVNGGGSGLGGVHRGGQQLQASLNGAATVSVSSGGCHNFTATTITLLWVSFYLIFTTLPVTLVFAIQTTIPHGDAMPVAQMAEDPVWQRYLLYYSARIIIREIGMTHHVGNVFIYLATSRRFRRQVRKRLLKAANTPLETTEVSDVHNQGHPLKVFSKITSCDR